MPRKSALFHWKVRKGWYATINGTRTRFGDTREQAEGPFKAALKASEGRTAVAGSVAEWFDVFLDHIQTINAKATYDLRKLYLTSLANHVVNGKPLGLLPIGKLDLTHIDNWLAANKKNGGKGTWGPAAQCAAISAFKVAIKFLIKKRVVQSTDFDLTELKRPTVPGRTQWIDAATHEAALATVTETHFRDTLIFLWETGCRPKEMYSLRLRHVHIKTTSEGRVIAQVIYPPEEMPKTKTGGLGKPRIFNLSPNALEVVQRRALTLDSPESFIFTNTRGHASNTPWNIDTLISRFALLRNKMGTRKLSAYQYRHGYGTRTVKKGELSTARQMGHATLKMLHQYYDHSGEIESDMQDFVN